MAGNESGGAVRELLAVFGFGIDDSELKKGETTLSSLLENVKKFAEGVAAAFAVDAVYEFAESQARAMNAIERTGAQLGITTDRVQEFRFAAQSLGLDADALVNSMGRLQVSQQMAADGGKEQALAFQRLGVSIKDANGHFKTADELTLDVADGIAKMTDPAKQAAAAQYLFGRSGRELLPFLKEGRAGAEEYFKAFKENGGGYTEEALKAGKEFDKQQAKTDLAFKSLKGTISQAVLPIITALSKGIQVAAKWFNEIVKNTHVFQVALIGLAAVATPFAISMAIAFAPILLAAAGVAALILLLDDLWGFLNGDDSVTGEILDKIFGKGAQTDILEEIRNDWYDITEAIKNGYQELKHYNDMAERAAVIARTLLSGGNVEEALQKHEQESAQREEVDQTTKDNIHRFQALKRGRIFKAEGETDAQAELAANVIRYQNPQASPDFGPLPFIPGVSKPGPYSGGGVDHRVQVEVNAGPGFEAHVTRVTKQERKAAAATVPRAGN